MNPEIKKRWVAALRSGGYRQARGWLKTDEGFCCLGVLCDLHRIELNKEWKLVAGNSWYLGETASLPSLVSDWAGLTSFNPKAGHHNLSAWNDAFKKSFPEIADIIEAHL